MLVRLAVRTRPAPEILALPAYMYLPVCLACCCLLRSLERGSLAGWVDQPHMLMLAHSSSLSESIVLCGFLVVYVAMPAPRPSSQAADLRRNARERPPPLGAPEGCSATVRLRSVGGVKVGCTHPVCLAEWWSPWRHGCRTPARSAFNYSFSFRVNRFESRFRRKRPAGGKLS